MVDFCCIVIDEEGGLVYHTHIQVENELRVGPELVLQGVLASAVEERVDMSKAYALTVEYKMEFTQEARDAVRINQQVHPAPGTVQ